MFAIIWDIFVCVGQGGYKISEKTINLLKELGEALERGDFTLISSRDHTVSDVVSYVFGCSRRNDPKKNQYFIDPNIKTSKREYHILYWLCAKRESSSCSLSQTFTYWQRIDGQLMES